MSIVYYDVSSRVTCGSSAVWRNVRHLDIAPHAVNYSHDVSEGGSMSRNKMTSPDQQWFGVFAFREVSTSSRVTRKFYLILHSGLLYKEHSKCVFDMKTVLIVEDESSLRGVIREALEHHNFQVLEASNGEEGLVIALQKRPDIILLDLAMPRMNGHEMLRALRQDTWGTTVKVVVMTNEDDVVSIGAAHEHAITEYIIKSNLDLEDLIKRVRTTVVIES